MDNRHNGGLSARFVRFGLRGRFSSEVLDTLVWVRTWPKLQHLCGASKEGWESSWILRDCEWVFGNGEEPE
jgi:hypothetical protein